MHTFRPRNCGSARFVLLGEPFHGAGGPYGFGALWEKFPPTVPRAGQRFPPDLLRGPSAGVEPRRSAAFAQSDLPKKPYSVN